nr:hypothetical protein [Tanacetum cinerariifolium]
MGGFSIADVRLLTNPVTQLSEACIHAFYSPRVSRGFRNTPKFRPVFINAEGDEWKEHDNTLQTFDINVMLVHSKGGLFHSSGGYGNEGSNEGPTKASGGGFVDSGPPYVPKYYQEEVELSSGHPCSARASKLTS